KAAAFSSALARFRTSVLPGKREREARNLVTSLTRFRPEEEFGAHWSYLHAEACGEVGLTEQAMDSYLTTIRRLPAASLRSRAMLAVAQQFRADDRLTDAAALLSAAEVDEDDAFRLHLQLQSALVALQRGDSTSAITTCRSIITSADDEELQRDALKTLGRAYELQNNHRAAVYCYAGMLPAENLSAEDPAGGSLPSLPSSSELSGPNVSDPETLLNSESLSFPNSSARPRHRGGILPVSGVRRFP
ncbi:MAG: hypothetical protein KDA89_12330, partial [Planctomycetaceae bacterium]|nr:hypothetical protein [Planctomycetaceae bacterium]